MLDRRSIAQKPKMRCLHKCWWVCTARGVCWTATQICAPPYSPARANFVRAWTKSGTDGDADAELIQKMMQKAARDLHWQALLRHNQPMKPIVMAVEGALAGGTKILQGTDIRAQKMPFWRHRMQTRPVPALWLHHPSAPSNSLRTGGRNFVARPPHHCARSTELFNQLRSAERHSAGSRLTKIAHEIADDGTALIAVQPFLKSLRENQQHLSEKEALANEEQLGYSCLPRRCQRRYESV